MIFDFESTGNLDDEATRTFGNGDADFTFVTDPFGDASETLLGPSDR
ncbi:MAG: hypothetical protein ACSHYF_00160 [Verrucomicrobiaceae bacterium]